MHYVLGISDDNVLHLFNCWKDKAALYERKAQSKKQNKTKGGPLENPKNFLFQIGLTLTPHIPFRPCLQPKAVDLLNLQQFDGPLLSYGVDKALSYSNCELTNIWSFSVIW